jgi:uncharacterized protein (TIGR02452 family)
MATSKAKTNIAIWLDTLSYCSKYKTKHEPAIKYSYLDKKFSSILQGFKPSDKPAKIYIENMDSFDMARVLCDYGSKPLVLNLASFENPGGGVEHGAIAQEEDLYRKSNYVLANNAKFYPLKMDEVVYSPTVQILKDSDYKYLETPVTVSCLAVAAVKFPKLKLESDGNMNFADEAEWIYTRQKIDMIFETAIYHGHKCLVLGAIGCGVYGNPPKIIAGMFKQAVKKYRFYFEKIGFAVLSGKGNPNYDIFSEVFTRKN